MSVFLLILFQCLGVLKIIDDLISNRYKKIGHISSHKIKLKWIRKFLLRIDVATYFRIPPKLIQMRDYQYNFVSDLSPVLKDQKMH